MEIFLQRLLYTAINIVNTFESNDERNEIELCLLNFITAAVILINQLSYLCDNVHDTLSPRNRLHALSLSYGEIIIDDTSSYGRMIAARGLTFAREEMKRRRATQLEPSDCRLSDR
jgi:hypothetical protein